MQEQHQNSIMNDATKNEISSFQQQKHPERFWVDYVIEATSKPHAEEVAREICLEQTVELPGTTQAVKQVEAYTVGTIERIKLLHSTSTHRSNDETSSSHHSLYRVTIAYPNETAGNELPQFLNVVFGNTSLKHGVSVHNVTLSRHLMDNTSMFPGPRFGVEGLRRLMNVSDGPLLCTALKPMGNCSKDFAEMAYSFAKGGIDIIKDDHGLQNQVWAPFEERVQLCAKAVKKANQETGRNSLYAPCLNAPADQILSRAYYAKSCGAGAVMILPGLVGWDIVRVLASDSNFGLPILIHPAMLGGWLQQSLACHQPADTQDEEEEHPQGLSHYFLFGVLPRLCGADAVIFCNAGGRFQFTTEQCQHVAEGCRRPMGRFESVFPAPAGGMKLDKIQEMRKRFGDDTLFLIGGNLLEQGPDLEMDAKMFVHCAGRDDNLCGRKRTYDALTIPTANTADPIEKGVVEEEKKSDAGEAGGLLCPSVVQVEWVAECVTRRVLEYTLKNNGGYLSQACSGSIALATLYLRALRLGPSIAPPIPGPYCGSTVTGEGYNGDPTNLNFDRLIFSPVHYAVVLYSLLVEIGRLDEKAFDSYNVDGSTVELIGAEHSPGHAVTAGSLAQALSQAAGIAYARKLRNASGRVVVFMSDGEFQEGQTWEAVQAMVNHRINLVAVVDVNGQQCDGKMDQVCDIGDLAKKLRAFGAVVRVVNGHNVSDIEMAVKARNSLPQFVLCMTDPCYGLPMLKSRAPKLHYIRFKDSQEKMQFEKALSEMNAKDGTGMKLQKSLGHSNTCTPASKVQESLPHGPSNGQFSEVLKDIETVSRPHRSHLLEWMKTRPRAIVVTADLTSSCEADLLRDTLPNQYLSFGMAEQNMMSFCGGLAREGFLPLVHTFGVFVTRRPFDQLAMSIAAPNLKVILLGFLPGIISPGGITHQAIDDTALCRSIPNLRVLEVSDATEVESVLDVAESINGPVYIRMLRGDVPRLFPKYSPMKFGEVRILSEGNDVAIITSGICTQDAIQAKEMMTSSGVSIRHLHLSTIVPFAKAVVLDAANSVKYGVITLENHSIVGGIGSATAELLAEHGVGKPLIRLGLPGCYAHGASRKYLQAEYNMDSEALIKSVEKLCHKKLVIEPNLIPVSEKPACLERAEDL
eukprot:CCRYP_003137-RA/>CCRYP_003137-RA protein AED:0.00 eAED:0.00 QI:898/1/1/1/1/1/2/261/1143